MTEPTNEDLNDPMFEAVWKAIKKWDISREPSEGRMYSGATGTDVMTILEAIRPIGKHWANNEFKAGYEAAKKQAVEIATKLYAKQCSDMTIEWHEGYNSGLDYMISTIEKMEPNGIDK